MPDKLDIRIKPPEDVMENVELFIEGKATFHELPPKQGRKRRVIRTIADAGGDSNDVPGGTIGAGLPVQRELGVGRSGLGSISSTPAQHGAKRTVTRRRHPRTNIPKSSGSSTSLVTEVAVPKAITTEPAKGTEVVKRKRGRPKGIK